MGKLLICFNLEMYYEQDKSSTSGSLKIGPFSISQTQIVIGVISNLIIFPPSFLLVQLFKRSRKRKSRSIKLRELIKSDEKEKIHGSK